MMSADGAVRFQTFENRFRRIRALTMRKPEKEPAKSRFDGAMSRVMTLNHQVSCIAIGVMNFIGINT